MMNRIALLLSVSVSCLISSIAVNILAEENISPPKRESGRNLKTRRINQIQFGNKPGHRMPSFVPKPNIDYKILRLVVDESFDYKINDIEPHYKEPYILKPRKKKFLPRLFLFRDFQWNPKSNQPENILIMPLPKKRIHIKIKK